MKVVFSVELDFLLLCIGRSSGYNWVEKEVNDTTLVRHAREAHGIAERDVNIFEGLVSTDAQLLSLYEKVGWISYTADKDKFSKTIRGSLDHFCIMEKGTLIGYARILGDGITTILIQDLLVDPEYQHKGLGSLLIKRIKDRYASVRQIIVIMDKDKGLELFYTKNGFRVSSEYGCSCLLDMK